MVAVLWLFIILVTSKSFVDALMNQNNDEQLMSTKYSGNRRSSNLLDVFPVIRRQLNQQQQQMQLISSQNAPSRLSRALQMWVHAFPSRAWQLQIEEGLPDLRREVFVESDQFAELRPEKGITPMKVAEQTRNNGVSYKFCNTFGCDCTPPANAKCCSGYRYDRKYNKCRELF
ncbi:hypothetical protein CDAR_492441 [Caerostris darwini]|uniref:Uncharacterized protein n=1 Tax=Caerostris darwini TaxID=1538125 RepID=A0AAV4UZ00_9ARAC|nr:hypothetical protein CDAR_492441 [Caerostris darwini]